MTDTNGIMNNQTRHHTTPDGRSLLMTREERQNKMAVLLGGRAADDLRLLTSPEAWFTQHGMS